MTEARKLLGLQVTLDEEFEELALQLMGHTASFGTVQRVADVLWDWKPMDASPRQETNRDNRLATLSQIWESDTCSGGFGPSAWSAWNALTEYLDHHGPGDADKRAERALFSQANDVRKVRAAELILA